MNLQDKKWSFSSVNMYRNCPYSFKLKYIDGVEELPNAAAQHGKLTHSILERYFKGELYAFELSDVFESEYESVVTEPFPFFNIYKSFYNKTLEYLQNFDGLDDKYKIVSVEQELSGIVDKNITYPSKGYRFIGYADLILEDEEGLIIVDHKSHGAWKSKKERHDYFRQLYIYAYVVQQMYGKLPYKLVFNKFRTGEWDEELFNSVDCREAVNWFVDSVDEILKTEEWDCKPSSFFCDSLCGYSECPYNGRDISG